MLSLRMPNGIAHRKAIEWGGGKGIAQRKRVKFTLP